MTLMLKKPVKRITNGKVREAGKQRNIIVILRPPNVIGFRAKGCRGEYRLTAEVCYTMAVGAHVQDKRRQKKVKKRRTK